MLTGKRKLCQVMISRDFRILRKSFGRGNLSEVLDNLMYHNIPASNYTSYINNVMYIDVDTLEVMIKSPMYIDHKKMSLHCLFAKSLLA